MSLEIPVGWYKFFFQMENTYRTDESKWVKCSCCIYRKECETRELRTSCAMGVKERGSVSKNPVCKEG